MYADIVKTTMKKKETTLYVYTYICMYVLMYIYMRIQENCFYSEAWTIVVMIHDDEAG